ncbi:MAG: hypothetical protein ACPGVD_03640 [Flavobacteriales bacterium]
MKQFTLIILALFTITYTSVGQGKIKTTQKIIELEKGRKGEAVINSEIVDNFTYSITSVGKGRRAVISMSKYDPEFKLVKKVDWDLDIKENSILRMTVLKGNIFVLFKRVDSKNKFFEIVAQPIDKVSLKLSSKKISLLKKAFKKKRLMPDYTLYESKDKLLVYCVANIEKEKRNMQTKLYDSNLRQIWEKDILFDLTFKDSDIEDYELNDNGDVYFVLRNKRKEKNKDKSKWEYYLYATLNNGEKTINRKISEIPEFIGDITLKNNPNNELVVAGFYNEKIQRDWKKGAYFSVVDGQSLAEKTYSQKLFTTTLLMEHKSKKVKRKAIRKENKGKETGLDMFFDVREIISKENGGAIMIGEHYHWYTVTTTTTDANGNTRYQTHTNYELDDIIVVSIDKDGEIEWERIIPKIHHTSRTTITSSYVRAVVDDKLYFIFNDHRDNHALDYEYTKSTGSASRKNLVVSVYELNSKGFLRKDILTDHKKIEGVIVPTRSQQVGDKEVLLYIFARKRVKKLLMVKFED